MNQKYILIKGKFGIGGRIAVLASAILLSKATNRTLLVDWNDGYYDDEKNDFDVYSYFISNPDSNILNFYENLDRGATVYPQEWNIKDLILGNNPYNDSKKYCHLDLDVEIDEDIIVLTKPLYAVDSKCMKEVIKSLRFSDEIYKLCNDFYDDQIGSRKLIGVHVRHGNGEPRVLAPNLDWFIEKINNSLKINPDAIIFLATDSKMVEQRLTECFGNSIVSYNKNYWPSYGPLHNRNDLGIDKLRIGLLAFVDMLLLSMANELIITGHYFGRVAKVLNGDENPVSIYPGKTRTDDQLMKDQLTAASKLGKCFIQNGVLLDGIVVRELERLTVSYGYDELISFNNIDDAISQSGEIASLIFDRRGY